uniref:Uncharacterized protein n=1 Tax=Oryza meridionalis TaxID=40149 RepID=A0A0E0CAP1_9ORYZ
MCGTVGLAPIIRIVRLSVPNELQDEPMHTWIIKSWILKYEDSIYSVFLDNENPSLRKRIL